MITLLKFLFSLIMMFFGLIFPLDPISESAFDCTCTFEAGRGNFAAFAVIRPGAREPDDRTVHHLASFLSPMPLVPLRWSGLSKINQESGLGLR